MQAKKIKIASLIITYNRVDEAKAQMDIIRELWQPLFAQTDIYHEFNGKPEWYQKKYREDHLHRHKPLPHFVGANHMLNLGFKHILGSGKKYDYIIATSADTWFFEPKRLKELVLNCQRKKIQLATSLWAGMVFSTEFFIISPELAKKAFPLRFIRTINKLKLLKWAQYSKIAILETIFTVRILKVLKNPNKIYLIPGRKTVWPKINRYWSPFFYASHHDRNQRKRDILPKIHSILGDKINNMPNLNKFLA